MADQANIDTTFGRQPSTGSVDWIRGVALAGVCLDAVTTWIVLTAGSYRELNPMITALWDGHPLLVAAYFSGLVLAVAVATRRRGRVAAAISAYIVVVMGVFGGGNNLALFAIGPPSLLELLAGAVGVPESTVVVTIAPACGLVVAAGAAWLRRGSYS
ncbi:MAG: DUF5658 family protein [Halohasta sp.]